ncbi:MAG: glycerophosphoryl diester phosphodiesterase [Actinomycetota bacterium]|nr:glycerophosphoryl diester phosphodiesterase [Actinomycetota bacterium]
MRKWAYLDHPGPAAFAHRGGAKEAPENTMVAFGKAVDLGFRYLETDVRATSDGKLVVFHDEMLDRLTGRTGCVEQLPWSEVSQARIDGQPIPLLDELLAAFPEHRFNIDAKGESAVAPLAAAIERARAHDRVCVGAFSEGRLRRFRHLTGGHVCTSMGRMSTGRMRVASARVPMGPFRAGCAQVPVRHGRIQIVDRLFVNAAHRRGIAVHVWTIDEPEEMNRLLDLGVDGLMTDVPTTLRKVLEQRGQWVP